MHKTILSLLACLILSACKLDYVYWPPGTEPGTGGGGGGGGTPPPPPVGFAISSVNGGIDILQSFGAGGAVCTQDPGGDLLDTETLNSATATNITVTVINSQFTSTDGSCTGTETLLLTTVLDYTDYGTTTGLGWNTTPPVLQDGSGNMPATIIASRIMVTYTTVIDHVPTDWLFPIVPQGTSLPMVMYIDDTTANPVPYFGDPGSGVDAQGFANAIMLAW